MDFNIEKTFKKISKRASVAGKAAGTSPVSATSAPESFIDSNTKRGRNADRDWQIMIALFVLIVAVICFWGTNLFYSVKATDTETVIPQADSGAADGSAVANSPNAAYPLLTQSNLSAVTARFQAQSAAYASEFSGGGAVSDPSL